MPEAEWQALDARIAQEVMGWILKRYSEAPTFDAQRLVWYVPVGNQRQSLQFRMWKEEWQPHKDVAQAMMALDVVVKRGFDTDIKTRHYDSLREIWIVPAECRGPCWLGVHESRAKAICLAAEQWMDAPKELQDDPG